MAEPKTHRERAQEAADFVRGVPCHDPHVRRHSHG